MNEQIHIALDRLDKAIAEHEPIAVFGLFSGGHDSFCSTYIASLHPAFTGAVHINTGTGIAETRNYVRRTCEKRNWPLFEYKAIENTKADGTPDPQIYADIVRKHGFPGAFSHRMMYSKLKERSLRRLERDFGASARGKKKKRVMLVSGCRTQESTRRMANTEEVQIDGRRIWVAPIHDWSKLDTSITLELVEQPRNIIVDLIHKSGECLCGAFAKKGEMEELNLWPQTRPAYRALKKLEKEIVPKFGWGWEEKPPKKADPNQGGLFSSPLCWSCTNVLVGA